jgi:hypothetical protein
MKHVIALVLGLLVGALLFVLGMTYNPFVVDRSLSPLAVTDEEVMTLNFSAVPAQSILFTNAGDLPVKPSPAKVQQLWEETIRQSSVMAVVMRDARNQTAGLGIKFSSLSEGTRLLNGEALVNSTWYVFLPDRGSLFIEQSENYWDVLREVYIPAYRNSAKSWKGNWIGDITIGPGVLGTAIVTGGAGSLRGTTMQSSESLSISAYSIEDGPVSAEGRLLIEMPKIAEAALEVASGR